MLRLFLFFWELAGMLAVVSVRVQSREQKGFEVFRARCLNQDVRHVCSRWKRWASEVQGQTPWLTAALGVTHRLWPLLPLVPRRNSQTLALSLLSLPRLAPPEEDHGVSACQSHLTIPQQQTPASLGVRKSGSCGFQGGPGVHTQRRDSGDLGVYGNTGHSRESLFFLHVLGQHQFREVLATT